MRTYTLADIENIGGKPTVNRLSYGTVYSVTGKDFSQYSFVFFPFADGDAFFLVAIDGNPPEATIDLNRIICPGCGWDGDKSELGTFGSCPECSYESFDGPLFSVKEIMEDDGKTEFTAVRLDLFLKKLLVIKDERTDNG